jgi:hypothetical protein
MIWSVGGILLWLGGWWFTGQLFKVYRKAVYLEEMEWRAPSAGRQPSEHHRGILAFAIFDLGLLVLGIRSAHLLLIWSDPDTVHCPALVQWSWLLCIYLFRLGFQVHQLYHARWRARTGSSGAGSPRAGTLAALRQEVPPVLRPFLLVAPAVALIPLASAVLDWQVGHPVLLRNGAARPVLIVFWILVTQGLLALALGLPAVRLRRRVHACKT